MTQDWVNWDTVALSQVTLLRFARLGWFKRFRVLWSEWKKDRKLGSKTDPNLNEKQILLANERQARDTFRWSEGSGFASVLVPFFDSMWTVLTVHHVNWYICFRASVLSSFKTNLAFIEERVTKTTSALPFFKTLSKKKLKQSLPHYSKTNITKVIRIELSVRIS